MSETSISNLSRYQNGSNTLAEAIRTGIREALKPPTKLTVSEWAERHAVLSVETTPDGGKYHAHGFQVGIMNAVSDPSVTMISVIKSARVGFALALDTPIPTASGWVNMGDITVGERVFDEHGDPCQVTYVSPIFEDHDCYEIECCDGSKVTADADHRWYVEADVSFEYLRGERGAGRTGRPKPGEVATKAGVVCTEDLFTMQLTSRGRTSLAIPVAGPLDLPVVDLPIPPYTLGLWLGDGTADMAKITQCVTDTETAIYIENEGIKVHIEPDARWVNNRSYYLDSVPRHIEDKSRSPWSTMLRSVGFRKTTDKRVPPQYLRSSRDQRLAILRGLMDSDGTIYTNGFAEFNNTNKQLALDVYELICSLGMKVSISERPPQRDGYLLQYRVVFKPCRDCNPFNLKRKADRVRDPAKPSITKRRRIVSVTKVASVKTRCISVDSANSLFLCGRGMIPTHNTKILDNIIGFYVHQEPSPILVVQPTIGDAEDYSRTEIAPMLRDTKVLAEIMGDVKTKDPTQRIDKRMFRNGSSISFVGANSPGGFRRITTRIVLFDEVDGYPSEGAGDEGDQISLGIKRTTTVWGRKIVLGSTPTLKETSRIEKSFAESDQRHYHVPCPQCGHKQVLKWENLHWNKDVDPETGKTIKHYPETAFFACTGNGCVIEEHNKIKMIDDGEWIAERPFNGHAGFKIWQAYSLFPNASWQAIVEDFLKSKNDPTLLQTFVNLVLGETWEEQGEKVDASNLIARVENYDRDTIPEGVKVLTAGVDTQDDRLELIVVGWGAKEESWVIAHEVIIGDPAQPTVWSDLDTLLTERYHTEDGRVLRIRTTAVDTGGHHSSAVYQFTKDRHRRGVYAIKGGGVAGKPIWPKRASKGGKSSGDTLYVINVDAAKDAIYARLRIPQPGPGYIHFAAGECDEGFFDQLTAEQVVTRYKAGRPYRVWVPIRRRNEALDMFVYAFAALRSTTLRLDRLGDDHPAQTQPTPLKAIPAPVATPAPDPVAPAARAPRKPTGWLGTNGRNARQSWL